MRLFIMLLTILGISLTVYSEDVKMASVDLEKNKELVRKIYEDCINSGKLELITELVSDDYVGPGGQSGPTGFKNNIVALKTGFPDIQFTIEDLIADADRVAVRWQWKGTHKGTFGGYPASQNPVVNDGIAIFQIKNKKILRSWLQNDRLGALQQMGVISKEIGARPQTNQK